MEAQGSMNFIELNFDELIVLANSGYIFAMLCPFEYLPDELVAYIISFLPNETRNVLHAVSRELQTMESKTIHYCGEGPNGTLYNIRSFLANGPRRIQYLNHINLSAEPFTHVDESLLQQFYTKGLHALDLQTIRRPIDLSIDNTDWANQKVIPKLFHLRRWQTVRNESFVWNPKWPPLRCDSYICSSQTFRNAKLEGLKFLDIQDYVYDFKEASLRQLSTLQVSEIRFRGVFYDAMMQCCDKIRPNLHVKHLTMVHQGVCTWTMVRSLQTFFPNIESFELLESNLIPKDFEAFDWSLWPSLKSLSVEYNGTLTTLLGIPNTLECLYFAHTQVLGPHCIPTGLQLRHVSVHCSCSIEWAQWFSTQNNLESVRMTLTCRSEMEFACEIFWKQLKHVKRLHLDDYNMRTYVMRYISKLRAWLPNTLVTCKEYVFV